MPERRALGAVVALAALALGVSACGTTALSASNGAATVPSAPRWQSEGEVDTVAGASWAVVPYPGSIQQGPDGNLRPLWILYRVTPNGQTFQVTPRGITTRGGLALSAVSATTAWALVGSYRYELDGAITVTRDGGRHWSHQVVPASVDPTPDGIAALSATSAVVLAGSGHRKELLSTTDGGARWRTLASASALLGAKAATCELSGVATGRHGALWIGTSCRSASHGLVVVREAGGALKRWSLGNAPGGTWVGTLPEPGPNGVVLSVSWGRSDSSVEGAELFAPSSGGAPQALGGPMTMAHEGARVRLALVSSTSPVAVVVQRPDQWLDQGATRLVLGGGAWRNPAQSQPPASGRVDDLGLFPGSSVGAVLAAGSTKTGTPALWRVAIGGGALRWTPLHLVIPKTATAANLEGAGS